jgi:hypothetical protein
MHFSCTVLPKISRISFRSYDISSAHHHHHHHHPPSLLHSSLAGSRKRTGLTDQAFLMHCSAKNFLTIRHVLGVMLSTLDYTDQGKERTVLQAVMQFIWDNTLWGY